MKRSAKKTVGVVVAEAAHLAASVILLVGAVSMSRIRWKQTREGGGVFLEVSLVNLTKRKTF